MRANPAPLYMAQTVLAGLVAAMGAAIVGTSAHSLDVFNKQQTSNPWWLPLWPQHFDVHGTKALLASGVVAMVLSSVFLILSLLPAFRLSAKPTQRALLLLSTSGPSALLALATVIYTHMLNHSTPELDTIQTWTCKYRNSRPLKQQDITLPSSMGNGNFTQLCQESRFALYGTLVVCVLSSVAVVVAVVGWATDKWAATRKGGKETDSGVERIAETPELKTYAYSH